MVNLDFWRGDRNTQRSLFNDMWNMLDEFDRSVSPLRHHTHSSDQLMAPPCDIAETDEGYVLSFDVPGLTKEDINIEVSGRQLAISGERKRESAQQKGSVHRVERNYGRFYRTFELPESANTEVIDANYENGVLKIAIPKAETSKPRKIQITEGGKGFFKRLGKTEQKSIGA